jgi:hypothetical protein
MDLLMSHQLLNIEKGLTALREIAFIFFVRDIILYNIILLFLNKLFNVVKRIWVSKIISFKEVYLILIR